MLRLEHLSKKFAEVSAVNDVSLSIPQGQMVGMAQGRRGNALPSVHELSTTD